jgi:hypothetical protein
MELVFTFKVDGEKLTGTVVSHMGEMEITNGKVNGADFSFDVEVMDAPILHTCKLEGDEIKMKIEMGDMGGGGVPDEMILKRAE